MKRYECLRGLAERVTDELVITSLAGTKGEWEALRDTDSTLYIQTMGFPAPVGLGMALGLPRRRVLVLDTEGSQLMNLNTLAAIGWHQPANLVVIVFDNQCYEATGGQPNATARQADLAAMARAAGIARAVQVEDEEAFARAAGTAFATPGPHYLVARVEAITRPVPPSPIDGLHNKYRFVAHIERTEGREILPRLPVTFGGPR
jgi:sulfopyruvate decarboxylase subunit beta